MIDTDFLKTVDGMTPHQQCEMLRQLASEVPQGQFVVEIGVYKGRVTVHLGAGVADGGNGVHVYAVDPWDLPGDRTTYASQQNQRLGRRYSASGIRRYAATAVQRAGVGAYVNLVRAFSVDAAKVWKLGPVGLLVIDGDHSKEAVLADFRAWRPHLHDDAVVVFDDYVTGMDGVTDAVSELEDEGEIEKVDIKFDRVLIARLPGGEIIPASPDKPEGLSYDEAVGPAPDLPQIEEPPRSGPGSGVEHWKTYAVAVTGRPAEVWDGMPRWEILEILIGDGHVAK
jgi:predicted O-methyltransferase YrrM